MTAKLTVTVAVDLDTSCVTVRPSGTLTSDNVRGLLAVVHRAERTLPGLAVQLDLEHVVTRSPGAFGDLRDSGTTILHSRPADTHGWNRVRPRARHAA